MVAGASMASLQTNFWANGNRAQGKIETVGRELTSPRLVIREEIRMNSASNQSMKPLIQRYMATQTCNVAQGLEQDNKGDVDWEAAATALLLEAYLMLSGKTGPAKAEEFIVSTAQNLKILLTDIIHDDAELRAAP